jgi:hypothetical protein
MSMLEIKNDENRIHDVFLNLQTKPSVGWRIFSIAVTAIRNTIETNSQIKLPTVAWGGGSAKSDFNAMLSGASGTDMKYIIASKSWSGETESQHENIPDGNSVCDKFRRH